VEITQSLPPGEHSKLVNIVYGNNHCLL